MDTHSRAGDCLCYMRVWFVSVWSRACATHAAYNIWRENLNCTLSALKHGIYPGYVIELSCTKVIIEGNAHGWKRSVRLTWQNSQIRTQSKIQWSCISQVYFVWYSGGITWEGEMGELQHVQWRHYEGIWGTSPTWSPNYDIYPRAVSLLLPHTKLRNTGKYIFFDGNNPPARQWYFT